MQCVDYFLKKFRFFIFLLIIFFAIPAFSRLCRQEVSFLDYLINEHSLGYYSPIECVLGDFRSRSLVGSLDFQYRSVPAPARKVNYLTNSYFLDFSKDQFREMPWGFERHWVPFRFFGYKFPLKNISSLLNEPGIRLTGVSQFANAHISSARQSNGLPGFNGIAFGGGAYIEAEMRFDPSVISTLNGWPSFWALSLCGLISPVECNHWNGQPEGFQNNVELDIFEYLTGDSASYATALHHWYGIPAMTCPNRACKISSAYSLNKKYFPIDFDFDEFHRYGVLWVPATNLYPGYVEFYLDGDLMAGAVSWNLFDSRYAPTDSAQDWAFSVIDRQIFILVFGAGAYQHLDIRGVSVWQKSMNLNWSN